MQADLSLCWAHIILLVLSRGGSTVILLLSHVMFCVELTGTAGTESSFKVPLQIDFCSFLYRNEFYFCVNSGESLIK